HRIRLRDLAAPNGSHHASGTALSGRDHFGGPSLSPHLTRPARAPHRSMLLVRTRHSYPDTSGRGRLSSVPLSVLLLSAGLAGAGRLPAMAQAAAPASQAAAPAPDAIKQREQDLEATRAQAISATEAREKLKADIAAIGQDRAKLNSQLIDVAAQV